MMKITFVKVKQRVLISYHSQMQSSLPEITTRQWIGFPEIFLLAIEKSNLFSQSDHIIPANFTHLQALDNELAKIDEFCIFLDQKNNSSVKAILKQIQNSDPNALIKIVTSLPSLSLLEFHKEDFGQNCEFYSVEEFALIISKVFNPRLEAIKFPEQLTPTEDFFDNFGLSEKQIQLLVLVSSGLTNFEISKRLNLSEKGIESAIGRLTSKFNIDVPASNLYNPRIVLVHKYLQLIGIL
jgi:hypothetical protein